MKKIISITALNLLLISGVALAQVDTLPKPGLTPESPLYFLDKFGEALRTFFTFNPEGRARLQIAFAAERISEIKVILETKGVDAPGIEVAHGRLLAHIANVATVLDSEKAKGKDVSKLASELDDKFEGPKSALKETFKAQERALESQKDELKAKIRDARRVGDTTQVEVLTKQLVELKIQKELLKQKEDNQEEALEKEEERIKEEMEDKAEVEKKIRKAEREKQEVLDEAAKEGITFPLEIFNAFDKHISEAKSALAASNFAEAKHHAKEAKKNLEKVDDTINNLEKAKEEQEELKEEQDEKARKDAKKETERLEKEAKKTEEESHKAEERLREAGKIEEEKEEMKLDEKNSTSSTQAPRVVPVDMRSGRFDDNIVDIRRRDTVRWVNRDSQPHWIASNPHPMHSGLPGFDALKPLGPGESYEFTFTQSGTFGYHDHLNPAVAGQVIVK